MMIRMKIIPLLAMLTLAMGKRIVFPALEKGSHAHIVRIFKDAPIGTLVLEVNAYCEIDDGTRSDVLYYLAGEDNDKFRLERNTIKIDQSPYLIGDTGASFELLIGALESDSLNPISDFRKLAIIISSENLHAPVFTQISYTAIVFRGSARGTEVLRVAATDTDIDQYNAAVRFEISHKKFFIMNATSGILTTKRSLANAGKQTEFVAIATDTGVPPMSTTSALTIHVTNISEPLMLNVYNRTFNAATVCWEEPSEGHVTGYRVEYYEVNAPLRYTRKDLDTATQTMCHQMYDLKDGGTYVIQVQGYNSDDMGIWGNITLHLRDTVHCSVGTCKNDGVCKNTTDDRYVCNCAQGYFGLHCEHYDPCQFRPCENGATCRNTTEGSYVCDCREGYFGQNCSTSNPCAPGPCQNGGLCFNTSNSTYKCSCIEGYHGPECQHYDPCHPMPCLNGGMCNSVDGHIICDCKLGWLGSRCEEFSPCLAWDPCKNAYHCMNLSNTTYTCSCKPGWSGENCTVYDACHTKECQNGAKCISNANRTFTCLCPDAFTGYRCEHERACHISLCKNNATCIDSGYGRYVCACPLGHYGHHCENYNPCYGRPCQNDGQCRRNGVSGYQCVCRNSYYGNRCEFYDACADESRCSNGTCHSLPDGTFFCRCYNANYGQYCENINPCAYRPCQADGICRNVSNNTYVCECLAGFSGENCEEFDICELDPCANGGTCRNVSLHHYECMCPEGYHGDSCQYVNACVLYSPCVHGVCRNQSEGTYTCDCLSGHFGTDCEHYNPCVSSPCLNNGKCSNTSGSDYDCYCLQGYYGSNCQYVNPCEVPGHALCHNGATCRNVSRSEYRCVCPARYYGPRCDLLDHCKTNPCANGATCTITLTGQFRCLCLDGYRGKLCDRAVDPCRSAPCLHGGKCSKTAKVAGRYQCACPTGYSGSDCQYLSTCPKAELPSSKGTYLWPETEHGNIVRLPCRVSAYGTETESFAVRFCKLTPEGSAVWTDVDGQHCKTSIMTAAEASSALNELPGDLPYLDSTYLKRALDVLELVSDFGNTNPKVAQQMFNVVSTMVGTNWTAHQPGNFTERLHTLIAKFLDEVHVEDRNGYVIDTDNIDLQVNLVTPETKSPLGIEFRSSAVSHINLPPEVATSQQERVKFVAYKNSKLFLAKANPNVGEVIAASVSNKVIKDLRECVRYSLPKPVMGGKYKCAFWMESEKRWSGKGVQKVADSEIAMECCSSHLTNFAILFEVDPESVQHMEQDMVLTIVSYIGSGLSILGLSLTLLTYTLFRCLNKDRSGQILLNVCLSMLFMNIIFVIGSDRDHVTGDTMCTVVAVLMHYLVLSTLLWMSVEAFNMYRMLITVFVTPEKLFLVKRMLVAWGLPMVCIGIAIAVDLTVYTGIVTDYCRMSAHNPYLYYGTYFGPACAILLFNCIIFFIVVRVVIRPKFDRQSETTKINLSQVKGAMTVLVLLGVSWIFGVLAIGKAKVFFQYAFCICNAAQGFCIFIFRCLNYPDARAAWIQLFTTGTLKKRRGTVIKSTIISNSNTHSSQSKADTDYTLVSSNERLHKSPKYSPSRYAHRNPVVPSPAKSNGRCSPLLSEEERQSAFNAQERRRDNSRPHHAVLDIRGVTQPGGGHPALGTSFAESGLYNTRL